VSFQSGKNMGLAASLIVAVAPALFVLIFLIVFLSGFATSAILWPLFIVAFGAGISSIVLFTVGMRRLADYYREASIFNNALYGLLLNIIGIVSAVAFEAFIIGFISKGLQVGSSNASAVIAEFMTAIFGLSAIIFVFGVVGALFYMRAFNSLAEKSGENYFKDAGLLIILGTALAIVFVGVIIVWVGWIIAVLGFRNLRATSAPSNKMPPQYAQPIPAEVKRYCQYCGAPNELDAKFCKNCGKQL
jgi:uncharacterized membrane protein